MTIDRLSHITIEGTDKDLAEVILPDILEQVFPVWKDYKEEWLSQWRIANCNITRSKSKIQAAEEYLDKNAHYDGRKRFAYEGIFVTIEVCSLGEGFFCTGPWLFIDGWESLDQNFPDGPMFRIKAFIEQ